MFLRLLLLFTIVPVCELALLIEVGQRLGMLPTVALVLGTGALGAVLARREGMQALHRLRASLSEGRFPGEQIFDTLHDAGQAHSYRARISAPKTSFATSTEGIEVRYARS